jgi:transposase-like protein
MGRAARPRPARLATKLSLIRCRLNLSLNEMIKALEYRDSPLHKNHLLQMEKGLREPSLLLLLRYARLTGLPLEILVDDALDLPRCLPNAEDFCDQIPPFCPSCSASRRQVRAGRNPSGTQRFWCRVCDRRYTTRPLPKGYSEETKQRAVRLYQGGMKNFRRIARTLGVNHQSVINWIGIHRKEGSSPLKLPPSPDAPYV